MASTQSQPRQHPFVLSYEPTEYSLHKGTSYEISPEELAQASSTERHAQKSHPPTSTMPSAFPTTPEPEKPSDEGNKTSTSTSDQVRADSALDQHRPLSPSQQPPREGVRRLFSLSSLRNSFSSSRTSLNVPHASYDMRPASPGPSVISTTASMQSHYKPPGSSAGTVGSRRNKRSSSWFRRKSGFFETNENGKLEVVNEDPNGTETRDGKRLKDKNIPHLPEVNALRGGSLNDGGLGWDERVFKA